MKRVLCLRFLNWPIQRLLQQLQAEQTAHRNTELPCAIHTVGPAGTSRSAAGGKSGRRPADPTAGDLRFIRSVFPSARTGPAIISVSDAAWMLGVRPGMPLAEARSMAQPLKQSLRTGSASARRKSASLKPDRQAVEFREWQPREDRRALYEIIESVRRFAPLISLDDMPLPDSLLLDITGCGPLFGGERRLAEQLLKTLQQSGWNCRIAISHSTAVAWALTHSTGHGLLSEVCTRRQSPGRGTVEDCPVHIIPPVPAGQTLQCPGFLSLAAGRLLPDDIDLLHQLGIRTLKQLLNLPREDLPGRLSAAAVLRIQQLAGVVPEPLTAVPEAHPTAAEWCSEFPAEDLNELHQVFEHLLCQICMELQQHAVGCIRLNCLLFGMTSPVSPVALAVDVVKPTQSDSLLMEILSLRLQTLLPVGPIHRVRVQAVTAPLAVARQRDLFSDTQHLVPEEELAVLVNRLSGRLGSEAVCTLQKKADVRPEFSIPRIPLLNPADLTGTEAVSFSDDRLHQLVTPECTVAPEYTVQAGSVVRRMNAQQPLRLVAVPFLLSLSAGESLIRRGFMWQGRHYQIRAVVGPQRLQTAWWTEQPIQRDYYRVLTVRGALFWIFRDLESGNWFLHGIFD